MTITATDPFFARIDADTNVSAKFYTWHDEATGDHDYISIQNGDQSVLITPTQLRDLVAAMDRKYGDVK